MRAPDRHFQGAGTRQNAERRGCGALCHARACAVGGVRAVSASVALLKRPGIRGGSVP